MLTPGSVEALLVPGSEPHNKLCDTCRLQQRTAELVYDDLCFTGAAYSPSRLGVMRGGVLQRNKFVAPSKQPFINLVSGCRNAMVANCIMFPKWATINSETPVVSYVLLGG